jgi:hypothetical protein
VDPRSDKKIDELEKTVKELTHLVQEMFQACHKTESRGSLEKKVDELGAIANKLILFIAKEEERGGFSKKDKGSYQKKEGKPSSVEGWTDLQGDRGFCREGLRVFNDRISELEVNITSYLERLIARVELLEASCRQERQEGRGSFEKKEEKEILDSCWKECKEEEKNSKTSSTEYWKKFFSPPPQQQ